jgi:hypothetical protein
LEVAEGGFIAGSKEMMPSGVEVGRFMVIDSCDEVEALSPIIDCGWG